MMLILKEACAFALHKNSFKQCRSTFSKTWGGIISTFLVRTLSFFHFAQVSDQIWKYDIESGSFKPTHTLFSLHVNCGFFSAAWQSLFQYSLFCRADSQTAVTASQKFSQASFLAFVKRREASGLGDSSCWKKGKLDVFFYIILWKNVKYELRVPGNWISSIMCTTVHKNPSHHMDNVTKMLLLPLYAGNSGWRKTRRWQGNLKKSCLCKKNTCHRSMFFSAKSD